MTKSEIARGVTAVDGTTKAKIERAALALFVVKGVDGATTREIAAAAGVSEGALYRYYPSKEEIARSLFAAIHERLAALIRLASERGDDIESRAEAIVNAFCITADEDWTLFSYHLLHTAHFLPSPPGKDDPVSATESIVQAAMDRGELPPGDAQLIAAMALGVVLQPALHKAHGRLSGNLSQHAKTLKDAVKRVLRARGES